MQPSQTYTEGSLNWTQFLTHNGCPIVCWSRRRPSIICLICFCGLWYDSYKVSICKITSINRIFMFETIVMKCRYVIYIIALYDISSRVHYLLFTRKYWKSQYLCLVTFLLGKMHSIYVRVPCMHIVHHSNSLYVRYYSHSISMNVPWVLSVRNITNDNAWRVELDNWWSMLCWNWMRSWTPCMAGTPGLSLKVVSHDTYNVFSSEMV